MYKTTFKLAYDQLSNKYFLCVFDKTALNEDGWALVDSGSRKDVLIEKAKSFIKLAEKDEFFIFSPDYDQIPVEDPFLRK